jgi:hypothetical protein
MNVLVDTHQRECVMRINPLGRILDISFAFSDTKKCPPLLTDIVRV